MKKIYDSVHGFIKCTDLETELIDSKPFQRLRYLRQLGITYMIYPGATHTRFEHSLGVMEVASRIFDQIIPYFEDAIDVEYWRQIVRLAALCHDLGHLPFSHVAEQALLSPHTHEKWTRKIIEELQFLQPDVIKIALGENYIDEPFTPLEKVLTQIITGDFFGADRIDYLLRDAKATGVSYGLFDYQQLIECLRILPSPHDPNELELGIEENGIESCEALLLSRHFMYKRVYQISSVKAYAFHMARFIATYLPLVIDIENTKEYLTQTDNEILVALREVSLDKAHPAHLDAICFLDRKKRYKAMEVSAAIDEKKLPTSIYYIPPTLKKGTQEFSFPVLTRKGKIVLASDFPLISIPEKKTSWVYVAPEDEQALIKILN